jgi:hypothetical protein
MDRAAIHSGEHHIAAVAVASAAALSAETNRATAPRQSATTCTSKSTGRTSRSAGTSASPEAAEPSAAISARAPDSGTAIAKDDDSRCADAARLNEIGVDGGSVGYSAAAAATA